MVVVVLDETSPGERMHLFERDASGGLSASLRGVGRHRAGSADCRQEVRPSPQHVRHAPPAQVADEAMIERPVDQRRAETVSASR